MIEKKFMKESMKRLKTKEYLKNELKKVGIVDLNIQRTTMATRISLTARKPGLIIGRKGKNIQQLTESLENDMGIENPKIEVNDVENPSLEPALIASWIAMMLERGYKQKRAMYKAAFRIMKAGAIGCEIILSGTWRKGGKARTVRVAKGYMKKAGDATKQVKHYYDEAVLKQGKIGIKVNIVPPGVVFPDKIDISKVLSVKDDGKEEQTEGTETAEPSRTEGKVETSKK